MHLLREKQSKDADPRSMYWTFACILRPLDEDEEEDMLVPRTARRARASQLYKSIDRRFPYDTTSSMTSSSDCVC